ncbi:MAG: DNA cytosine methyltransferase [Flavobacteriaceae bacterium]|nr:DNA cytosine methyltransferase [Flavobacteriaceae bacterium]
MDLHLPEEIWADFFCGGGGASTGMELASGRAIDIAINHNPKALGMHKLNHPNAVHYNESVWDVDPVSACKGRSVEVAWFSPDCTHHSKARGGKPKSKSIRGLAWVKIRWMLRVRPKLIPMENVEEFTSWGPLDSDGQPIKERAGETFEAFRKIITTGVSEKHPGFRECLDFLGIDRGTQDAKTLARGLGYSNDYRELRACDFGAPTTRKRFIMVSRSDGSEVQWPSPTHGPGLIPHRPASDCIDWSIPVPSIFDRKKPYVDNTIERIARGLKRHVIDSDDPFILDNDKASFAVRQLNASNGGSGLNQAESKSMLVTAFLVKHFGGNYNGSGISLKEPTHTITTIDHHALVYGFFIKYYSQGGQWAGLNEPLHTITTRDTFGLVLVQINGETYELIDIGMRGLRAHELYTAQSFPSNYIHDKWMTPDGAIKNLSHSDQVFMCGNSVPPLLVKEILQANLSINHLKKAVAA